jgi:hypothetical protein
MVQDFEMHSLRRQHDGVGEHLVVFSRTHIAIRVVVREHEGSRGAP